MIKIGKPQIYTGIAPESNTALLINSINIDNIHKDIWFKVDIKYKEYLCHERDDAYLIACLNYAMVNGHDIECEAPITEELLYKINTYLIPALIENNPSFHFVKIVAEIAKEVLPSAGKVGTGISCGVDSLHALAEHTNSQYSNLNITHLTFNNVGSHGEGAHARQLYNQRKGLPQKFAKEYGFDFVWSDSNLMDVIQQNHFKTHTYSSMFPVFCLQKLYSTYYYASSGYKFNEFKLADAPQLSCGAYEMLSLYVFSTRNLKIYSEGLGKSRINKLKEVIRYRPSHKYLNVCTNNAINCGKCEKCVRTLLGLDALKVLDDYTGVFDVAFYRANRKWYLQQLMNHYLDGKHDYIEMYAYFKSDITFMMRIKAMLNRTWTVLKLKIRSNEKLYKKSKALLGK